MVSWSFRLGSTVFAFALATANDVCIDNPDFTDEDGYTCEEWKGYDCNRAEHWGISEEGKQALLGECCASCNPPPITYPEGDACKDSNDFEDIKGYVCSDWEGYNCADKWPGYSFDDLQDVRENCCQTCSESCTDNWLFVDQDGYRCGDWKGYDCRQAKEEYDYTQEGEDELKTNCCATCAAAVEAEGCQDNEDFEDELGYACEDWEGYTCIAAQEIHEYSAKGEKDVLDNCCRTCTASCVDSFWFSDSKGYYCKDWEGYDCNTAASEWEYTEDEQNDILDNCCKTCSSFEGGFDHDDGRDDDDSDNNESDNGDDSDQGADDDEPLDLATYQELCKFAEDKTRCEDLGCKFKDKGGKVSCKAAKSKKKVKCKKVRDQGICERLGCDAKKGKCKGAAKNL